MSKSRRVPVSLNESHEAILSEYRNRYPSKADMPDSKILLRLIENGAKLMQANSMTISPSNSTDSAEILSPSTNQPSASTISNDSWLDGVIKDIHTRLVALEKKQSSGGGALMYEEGIEDDFPLVGALRG